MPMHVKESFVSFKPPLMKPILWSCPATNISGSRQELNYLRLAFFLSLSPLLESDESHTDFGGYTKEATPLFLKLLDKRGMWSSSCEHAENISVSMLQKKNQSFYVEKTYQLLHYIVTLLQQWKGIFPAYGSEDAHTKGLVL